MMIPHLEQTPPLTEFSFPEMSAIVPARRKESTWSRIAGRTAAQVPTTHRIYGNTSCSPSSSSILITDQQQNAADQIDENQRAHGERGGIRPFAGV